MFDRPSVCLYDTVTRLVSEAREILTLRPRPRPESVRPRMRPRPRNSRDAKAENHAVEAKATVV